MRGELTYRNRQTVFSVGNSVAVTVPYRADIKEGDKVEVTEGKTNDGRPWVKFVKSQETDD